MTAGGMIKAAVCAAAALVFAACSSGDPPVWLVPGGNPQQGKQLIRAYGCGACHRIPGIRTARGLVGPPLTLYGRRTVIAGELPNTPDNLIRWIQHPKAIEPHNAMPDLGLTRQQAADIAAYLYTLTGGSRGH
jgi:cytochrome c